MKQPDRSGAPLHPDTVRILRAIRAVPCGRVATYGLIASLSGNPRAARQVSRILHSCSERHNLPWHRIINAKGYISLAGDTAAVQRALLEAEGVVFSQTGMIDLQRYLWQHTRTTSGRIVSAACKKPPTASGAMGG